MIQLIKRGDYKIGCLPNKQTVLILDNKERYYWPQLNGSPKPITRLPAAASVASVQLSGKYRVCRVLHEPDLTSGDHLEISLGNGVWLSYLLPTGLPKRFARTASIKKTNEVITRATINHPK